MKIAFHAPRGTFLDPNASGGDPVLTRSLIEALSARGHQVEVVSYLDARDLARGRIPLRRFLREVIAIPRRMRSFRPDAWLVFGPSVTYPDLFGWWLGPRRYVLYAAHMGKKERLPRRWRWLFVRAHQRSLARADAITVQKRKSALRRERERDGRAGVHVMPPAPREWHVIPTREAARQRLELPADVAVVLCLARFPKRSKYGKTEMVVTLLRALARLEHEYLLLLVGDDGPGRGRVDEEIAALGLQAKVRLVDPDERLRLMGSIGNEDVPWFFAAADVLAYPHPLDMPWLSLVEAPACSRPVVTMRTESSELLVRHGETGLLADDEAEFRSYLDELLADRPRRESMGRAGREHFLAHLSMERHLDRLEELLLPEGVETHRQAGP